MSESRVMFTSVSSTATVLVLDGNSKLSDSRCRFVSLRVVHRIGSPIDGTIGGTLKDTRGREAGDGDRDCAGLVEENTAVH